jgi:ATP-dependent RNA helicase DeaD
VDIASAAVKLVHAAEMAGEADAEIPMPPPMPERRGYAEGRGHAEGRGRSEGRGPVDGRQPRLTRPAPRDEGRAPGRRGPGETGGDAVRLFIGAGREAGMRPGDLVGAITGEAGIASRDLGAIEIADRFSLIEVPEARAEDIMAALRATTIRGKKVLIRRDRGPSHG